MVCVGWVGGLEALIFHELGVEMVCVGWVGGLSTSIFHELGVEMACVGWVDGLDVISTPFSTQRSFNQFPGGFCGVLE